MNEINGTNQQEKEKKLDRQVIFWSLVGVGTVSFWCCVAIAFFAYRNREAVQYTIEPHPYPTAPAKVEVFEETFDTNDNNWGRLYGSNVKVENGVLTLQAAGEQIIGMTRCFGCDYLGDRFYFQADLLPEEPTRTGYGLVFCASGKDSEFYTLTVDPGNSTYSIIKSSKHSLFSLVEDRYSSAFHAYPESNTLGVMFDRGFMEFHINDSKEGSFTDPSPYACMWPGMIVNGGTVTIQVDNVFAYSLPGSIKP